MTKQGRDNTLKEDWLALPGIPAGSAVWEHLPVRVVEFQGIQDHNSRTRWELDSFVKEILPHYTEDTILLGHDLGGVVAAMATIQQKPRALVLTGTALGNWWRWTRLSATPLLNRFFYHTFKGNLFLRMGGGQTISHRFAHHPHFHNPEKMKILAQHMKPPSTLIASLKDQCPIYLIWGEKEVFYPGFLAKSLSKRLAAPLYWNPGGHYCMWTHSVDFNETMTVIEASLQK